MNGSTGKELTMGSWELLEATRRDFTIHVPLNKTRDIPDKGKVGK